MLILNKEYMIFSPKVTATKSGKILTEFTISDSTKTANGYKNEYYKMKIFGQLDLPDRSKVKFKSFDMISCYTSTGKDGKTYYNKDIYATLVDENEPQQSEEEQTYSIDELPF